MLFAPRWLLARSVLGYPAALRKQACVTERRLVKSCHYSEASCDVKQPRRPRQFLFHFEEPWQPTVSDIPIVSPHHTSEIDNFSYPVNRSFYSAGQLFVVSITKLPVVWRPKIFDWRDCLGPPGIKNGPKTLNFLSIYVNQKPFLKQKSYRPS